MYCIMVNMKLGGESDETKVLAGLQKLRGAVVSGYTALYTVLGEVARSTSEESMERLILTVSREEQRYKQLNILHIAQLLCLGGKRQVPRKQRALIAFNTCNLQMINNLITHLLSIECLPIF